MAADPLVKEIISTADRLKADRAVFDTSWQDIANYQHTNRNDMLIERTPGMKRMQYVYDSYPLWCRKQFAAGCHSFLTSSTLQWFSLRVDDDRIDNMPVVRAWLDTVGTAMYAVFNSPRYNFAAQTPMFYDDLGALGSGCMAVLENREGMPLFSARHLKEACWDENEEDRVDTTYRTFEWTAKKAFGKWGEKAGEKVAKAISDGQTDKKFKFRHAVRPRKMRDPRRAAENRHMVFESVYIGEADLNIISESGFGEFPFLCARTDRVAGELYGRGCGWDAQPDVKMLNELVKLVVKASQKIIDPPLDMPDDTYIVPIKSVPGAINIRRANSRPDNRLEPIITQGNIPVGNDMIERLHNTIGKMYFVDLLRMPSDPGDPSSEGKGSTATYWLQRREKEMMALAPFLAVGQAEFTGPAIDRVFSMMWRKSKAMGFRPGAPFPPPPSVLSGQRLRPEYVSPLAIAQKSSELDNLGRLIDQQARLQQIDPKAPITINAENIMRRTARDLNAPADSLKTADQLQQERDANAQAEQAMQEHMALANVAGAAKDGSAALKNLSDAQGGNDNSQGQAA